MNWVRFGVGLVGGCLLAFSAVNNEQLNWGVYKVGAVLGFLGFGFVLASVFSLLDANVVNKD